VRHVEFVVYGTPIPKGSTRAFFRPGMRFPVVTNDNAKTKPWQESVVAAARDAIGSGPRLEEPVAVAVRFFLPRPKSAPRRVVEPAKKPDLDKLVRCVEDGLTRAGVFRDDAQVVCVIAKKEFAGGRSDPEGERGIPRAWIEVGSFSDMLCWWHWPGESERGFDPAKAAPLTLFSELEPPR
jgi:Holliday junction resolvase RusA-like endonuclease